MPHLIAVTTSDLLDDFERQLQYHLLPVDALELFEQLFTILSEQSPMDMYDRNILQYDRFVFTHYLTIDREHIDKAAYHLLLGLYYRLLEFKLIVDNHLQHFPASMLERDLVVRRYNS